jgi:hypothetical protein
MADHVRKKEVIPAEQKGTSLLLACLLAIGGEGFYV